MTFENRPFQKVDEAKASKLWAEWAVPYEWDAVTIKWLRSRPQSIIDLLIAFPPDAKVKVTRPLDCPKPFEVGIAAGWLEDGHISVIVPGRSIKWLRSQANWLEVIEYRKGATPDDIRSHLGEQ